MKARVDHSKTEIFEALGITEKDKDELVALAKQALQESRMGEITLSQLVQELLPQVRALFYGAGLVEGNPKYLTRADVAIAYVSLVIFDSIGEERGR
jgi:hypothetical protein